MVFEIFKTKALKKCSSRDPLRMPIKVKHLVLPTGQWSELFSHSLLLNLTGPKWVATEDSERTQDTQTDRKLGPGVLGAQVETHNSLIASFLYYSLHLLCLFSLSLFFKALLLYSSLKPCF
jgi:hypothetical protein